MELATIQFQLPTGATVTIRETDGEDEDVISRVGDALDGASINKFISRIITQHSGYPNTRITPEMIKSWPLADKYYTLLKSRIHSLGEELVFQFTCPEKDCRKESRQAENLAIYDHDLSTGEPDEKDPHYAIKVKSYPNKSTTSFSHTLPSGKQIFFDLISGIGESKMMKKNRDDISKNDELRARNFKFITSGGETVIAENFRGFPSKEMAEIRKLIKAAEVDFKMETEIKCPSCGEIQVVPLIAVPDFFFPAVN